MCSPFLGEGSMAHHSKFQCLFLQKNVANFVLALQCGKKLSSINLLYLYQ